MPNIRPSSDLRNRYKLANRFELYRLIEQGMAQIGSGQTILAEDAFSAIQKDLEERKGNKVEAPL